MPSAASRSEVERLHRLMIEASIELARLDARVESARATVALLPELRPWEEAARTLSSALEQARGGLSSEGNAKERIDRVESALASIGERVAQFDLEFDLDECAAAWDDVARDLPKLSGAHRDALLKLHRELRPSIDAATAALFDAQRTDFLGRQRHRVAELEAERDEAREKYERLRQAWLEALAAVEAEEQAAFIPPLVPPPVVEEPEPQQEEDPEPPHEAVAEPPAEAVAPPVPVAVVAAIAEAFAEPTPPRVEPPAPVVAVEPPVPEIAAEPPEPGIVAEAPEPEEIVVAEPPAPELVVAPPPPKVVAEPPPKPVSPPPPVFVAKPPPVVVQPPPPEIVPKPPPEPIPLPEVQLAPEPEPDLPPLPEPEPELPQPPQPELTLPQEPRLTLPQEPEPELTLQEPEPPERPEPRPRLEEQLPEDLEFIQLSPRKAPERPANLVLDKPPAPPLEPAELKVVKPAPPPPKPATAKVVKPPPPPQPARQKRVQPPEPPLPPPPRFAKAPKPKPPELRPAKQIVVKRLPLPPPPRPVRAQEKPPPPKPAPLAAPVPAAPGPALPFAVERVERAGGFAAGTDGIGRGVRTATIWFRSPPAEALPVPGTIPIALGCATRLDVMPSLQLFAAAPDRPRRGKLTLTLVSSGGHLAGATPRKAHAAARLSAAEGAAQVAAGLGAIGRALSPVIRDVIEEAAGKVFVRALPAAEGGKLPLEELLLAKLRPRSLPARRVQDTLSHLVVAERTARLLVRRRPVAARDPQPERPSAVETPREPAGAIEVVLREDVRIDADRRAARDDLPADDSQELAGGSVETWTGSGEGVKLFSDVFAAFLPAEGALLRRSGPRGAQPRRGGKTKRDPDRREQGGFFARLFEDLERFADGVGRFAKSGSRLLGKGMHSAELGMHRLAQVERAAARVEAFTASAESFLERVGLHGLAASAGRAGEAAGWVDENAHALHRDLKAADRWMGEGKKSADEVARGAHEAAAVFDRAGRGRSGALMNLLEGSARRDGIDGGRTADALAAEPVLDEPRRLDLTTLSRMEAFLGDDLSGVRIHTGAGAAEVTRRFGADAVTVRDHVFFAPGRFNPSTMEGQKLIAHELTHVLQKGRRNLDVRTAEGEALHAEHGYGQAPAMETLSLRRPAADFRLAAEGEAAGAPAGVHTAKRTRSRGHEAGGKDLLPDGEEFLEQVSGRVYELLMEELEQSFESR